MPKPEITVTYLGVDAEKLEQARQAMERNVQRNFISSALDDVVLDALLTGLGVTRIDPQKYYAT
jgi:hypothetical protein